MRSRSLLIVRLAIIATAAFALLLVGLRQATAVQGPAIEPGSSTPEDGGGEPIIQATERTSIPYGFNAALPLLSSGAAVEASGQGACDPGDTVSFAITLTQSTSGAEATGQWSGTCTGERQNWTQVVTATTGPNFSSGHATGCAFGMAGDGSGDPDILDWCDSVLLYSDTVYRVFLPTIQKP